MSNNKYVYMFSEGDASMRNLLGGKGANLAEMTKLGLPIPQGFIVTTEACTDYNSSGKKLNDYIKDQVDSAIKKLGGGVRLDLIHEWDYLQYLFGKPQKIVRAI